LLETFRHPAQFRTVFCLCPLQYFASLWPELWFDRDAAIRQITHHIDVVKGMAAKSMTIACQLLPERLPALIEE
jgi:hypothetical protein